MTEVVATTPGLYPLPDWAKEDLADLKGHQKEDLVGGDEGEEVAAVYDRAREEVVDRQEEAGLDCVVEGQLRWDDMLAHPLAVHENVETRGIARYYDNNNFYREPAVTGELTFDGDMAADLEAAADHTDALQAVVPGPYSLSDLATDEHYGDGFLEAVAEFLAAEVEAFPAVETAFLLEPSLATRPPADGEDGRAGRAVDTVAGAFDAGTDVVVHTYWAALEETVYARLMDADVDAIGFDLVAGDPDAALSNVNEYGTEDAIALGLVDGQNTRVETPAEIRERVDWVLERTSGDFETVYATSNTELFYLPVNKWGAKLDALADAASLAEVEA